MRKLLWFTIGFASACVAAIYLLPGNWLLFAALFGLIAAVGTLLIKNKYVRIGTVVLLGCAAGMLWNWGYDTLYLQTARDYDGKTVSIAFEASDYSFDTGYATGTDGYVTLDGKPYHIRLYTFGQARYAPGDMVYGQVKLRYTAGNGTKDGTYHKAEGLFLLAYAQDDPYHQQVETVPAKYFPVVFRKMLRDKILDVFPEDTAPFAMALLLGDDTLLSFREDASFQLSGIRHVIAVSGLHVSILFGIVYLICGKGQISTVLLGIPVLLVFAAMAGFTPSVVRACVMQGLMIIAFTIDKEYDPPTALAFSVLVMLVCNPMTITSVSFQLSVGCMIGIFLFSERTKDFLLHKTKLGPAKGKSVRARLTRWFVGSLSVTLSAMTVTVPLCAWYFGMVSVIGIVTNLLTLWVISSIFYGIMVSCLLGWIWLPLGQMAAGVISWMIRYVTWMSGTLAQVPIGVVYTDSIYTVLWIVACYLLFGIFLFCKKKHPLVLGGCAAVLLCLTLAAAWTEPRLDRYRMTVMDMGQGQCVLLQTGESAYLVDCGGEHPEQAAMTALKQLRSQGIFQLDGIILTHYDDDHAGSAQYLMQIMPVDAVYVPDAELDSPVHQELTKSWGSKLNYIRRETILPMERGTVSVFPVKGAQTSNESSMCILFQGENCDILITGDRDSAGERMLMEQTRLPDVEVLVAGHHGAESSSCLPFLLQTMPDIVIISVGSDNPYGHPDPATLLRFQMIGSTVFRTDLNGTIMIRG